MVNFALFGAGRIGRMHAENLARRSDAKLLYVVDTKPEAARALAEPLGARQATQEQALGDRNVHAVLIASSTGSHADLSIAAAQARSEEHTSELQSPCNLVCRLLLEKKE